MEAFLMKGVLSRVLKGGMQRSVSNVVPLLRLSVALTATSSIPRPGMFRLPVRRPRLESHVEVPSRSPHS